MGNVEVGVAGNVTPLRLDCRSIIFCDMVDWFYRTNETMEINYEERDDRTGIVTIFDIVDGICRTRNFTIGLNDKKQIQRSYNFYH